MSRSDQQILDESKERGIIDLRSDTVTLPTEEMLEAIKAAKLGDDGYREDPTVRALEELAAEKMGKESALLVTSGIQGNLVSLLSHSQKGDEVILEAESHIYYYEAKGLSAVAGLTPRPIRGKMGAPNPVDVEAAVRSGDWGRTTILCLENTHNRAGGTIVPPHAMSTLKEVADRHDMAVHLDGARVFNAAVGLKVSVKEFAKHVDSLSFCLSKGLSAPVGSVVVGERAFIDKARDFRKMLGGRMRQAGIIAAAGIVALEKMVDRLEEDHRNARRLAQGLSKVNGIDLDLSTVQTNIVIIDVKRLGLSGATFVEMLRPSGVWAEDFDGSLVRLTTHRGISEDDIDHALAMVRDLSGTRLRQVT